MFNIWDVQNTHSVIMNTCCESAISFNCFERRLNENSMHAFSDCGSSVWPVREARPGSVCAGACSIVCLAAESVMRHYVVERAKINSLFGSWHRAGLGPASASFLFVFLPLRALRLLRSAAAALRIVCLDALPM